MLLCRIQESLLRLTTEPYECNFIDDYSIPIRRNRTFDNYGFKNNHKLDTRDFVKLCGGIPTNQITICEFYGTATSPHSYKVNLNYKKKSRIIAQVTRILDFKEMIIENHSMTCPSSVPYIGTSLLLNQIITARKNGFRRINLHAAGGVEYPDGSKFEGYHLWAKYGFIMDPDYQIKFREWIKNMGRKEKTVQHLILKDDGKELWENEGWHFNGHFDLTDNSKSIKHLRKYLVKKKINKRVT
jgi:hypothetical protein